MQRIGGSYRFLVLQRIKHILMIAKEAVEFDKQGDYTKALTLYSVCTTLLSSEITTWDSCCDESIKEYLIEIKSAYNNRIDLIKQDQLRSISSGCSIQTEGIDYSHFDKISKRNEVDYSLNPSNKKEDVNFRIKKMLNIVKYPNHPLTNTITIPNSIFDIDGVIIPLYQEKMTLCEVLGSISFDSSLPSLLFKSMETIFNALYYFKIQAKEKIGYNHETIKLSILPNKKLSIGSNHSCEHISEIVSKSLTKEELHYYQYNLKKSLETLIALPAFKVVAMENRVRTVEELEEDKKTIQMVNNCEILLNDVFIPLFMTDLHHLMEVYIDYRKHLLETI